MTVIWEINTSASSETVLSPMDMAQNILVIKTVSGMAHGSGGGTGCLKFSEVVGCIAGDDTIMVAVRTVEDTQILMDKIHLMIER